MNEYILAIESSCDDTSAAVLKGTAVLSNVIANQEVHRQYGGVVPELASRAHQQNIIPVVEAAIKQANIQKKTNKCNSIYTWTGTFRLITCRYFIFKGFRPCDGHSYD